MEISANLRKTGWMGSRVNGIQNSTWKKQVCFQSGNTAGWFSELGEGKTKQNKTAEENRGGEKDNFVYADLLRTNSEAFLDF